MFPDLQLDHPWEISTEQAIDLAIEVEAAGVMKILESQTQRGDAYLRHEGSRSMRPVKG